MKFISFLALSLLPFLTSAAPSRLTPRNSDLGAVPLSKLDISTVTPAELAALEADFTRVLSHSSAKSKREVPAVVVTTRNELVTLPGGVCRPIIVIFARGTTEPGNVGDDVGPSFFYELEKLRPGKVLVQGVNNYPASVWGYLAGGSDDAAVDMAASVALAASKCPSSKVVLSGFSQGAQVTHKAAKKLSATLYSKVAAIVLFGDPNNGDAFPGTLNNNVVTYCDADDLICDGWPIVTDAHGNYEDNGDEAARYVAARV